MTNTKKLIWRLSKLPTSEELRGLVCDKIITQDEAREILFSSETEEDRDKKSLESEIKFLRELVEKLANSQKVVEIIREIEKPYNPYRWWRPYEYWCGTIPCYTTGTDTNIINATSGSTQISTNFSDIKTF